jgi:hypothetical protein
MKKQIQTLILFSALCVGFFSCKDKGTDATPSGRDVKYELTGDFTGTFILVATTNNDNFEVIEVNKLPWKLEFTAKASIKQIIIQGSGTGGQQGQKATLKTYVSGKEVSTGSGTALSVGAISVTNQLYTLK